MRVIFGVETQSSDCHHLRLFVPSIVWLSLSGVSFPAPIRSIRMLTFDAAGFERMMKGEGRQELPDGSYSLLSGPLGQTIIDIDLTKLDKPGGHFEFFWLGAIPRDFESWLVRIPVNLERYPDIDEKWHRAPDFSFEADVSSSMNMENLRPDSALVSRQMGYTRVLVPSVTEGEISFTLKSPLWHNVAGAIQWISGIFFAIAAGSFIALISSGLRERMERGRMA
jgi:hypothetical protein